MNGDFYIPNSKVNHLLNRKPCLYWNEYIIVLNTNNIIALHWWPQIYTDEMEKTILKKQRFAKFKLMFNNQTNDQKSF